MSTATAPAPKPSATETILTEIKKIDQRLTPLEGLMKSLAEPASKVGLSPQDFFAKMSGDGKNPVMVGTDGSIRPVSFDRRKKGLGLGKLYQALATRIKPDLGIMSMDDCIKTLKVYDEQTDKEYGELSKEYGAPIIKTALAEGSGITGGYTVPPMFANQLLMLAIEDTIVNPRASHMPMTSLTLQVPSLDVTTNYGAGQSPFLGAILAQWTSEAATRLESEPQFRQTELKAHELSFYCVASNTLLADQVVGLDSLLTQLFSSAIGWYTDYSYFQGNGVGKPLGILNCPAALVFNRTGGANTLVFADVAGMWSKLYGVVSWRNPKVAWCMHPSVFPQLVQLRDASGRVVFIPLNQGVQDMPNASAGAWSAGYLWGAPVIFTEKLNQLGTKGDVILADFSKYLLGDRMDLQIDVSPHAKFLNNQMVWRVVWRGDGQPWLNNPITLADGSYQVSPFVVYN